MIEKPPANQSAVCHGSAFDFYDGNVAVKMCTQINMKDFTTIHHELGHIYYYLAYSDQPQIFKAGANPAFHEAVGDAIYLSVTNPNYFKAIGLLASDQNITEEHWMNNLMSKALLVLPFMPFGYLLDRWRWEIADGTIGLDELNEAWWTMRLQFQGKI